MLEHIKKSMKLKTESRFPTMERINAFGPQARHNGAKMISRLWRQHKICMEVLQVPKVMQVLHLKTVKKFSAATSIYSIVRAQFILETGNGHYQKWSLHSRIGNEPHCLDSHGVLWKRKNTLWWWSVIMGKTVFGDYWACLEPHQDSRMSCHERKR